MSGVRCWDIHTCTNSSYINKTLGPSLIANMRVNGWNYKQRGKLPRADKHKDKICISMTQRKWIRVQLVRKLSACILHTYVHSTYLWVAARLRRACWGWWLHCCPSPGGGGGGVCDRTGWTLALGTHHDLPQTRPPPSQHGPTADKVKTSACTHKWRREWTEGRL